MATNGTVRPRAESSILPNKGPILRPGSVRINVQGAFIVNDEPDSPNSNGSDQHETKDIRLPNHTATVSHIAVDVRFYSSQLSFFTVTSRQTLDSSQCSYLIIFLDRRLAGEACLFLRRTLCEGARRAIEFCQVRDGQD